MASTWRYQVVKTADGYGLFEVDDDDGMRTEVPVQGTCFESLEQLKADVAAMLTACEQPVIAE